MTRVCNFTAADALNLSKSALSMSGEIAQLETTQIIEEIKQAANHGKLSVSVKVKSEIIGLIMSRFTANGFTCSKSQNGFGGHDSNLVTISWE